jgi:sodium transport system permease protein
MNLSRIIIVARKELMDGFRDKRALYTVILSSLFGPLLIAFMLNSFAGQQRAAQEIKIPVVGQQYGPVLVQWLGQQRGVEIIAGPADAEAAVRDRKQEFVLVIDKDFAEKFRNSRPALVKVVSDSTRQSSEPKVRRLHKLLDGFNGQMGSLRLIAHGVSPVIASALKVEDVEISNAQQRSATIFNTIPLFIIAAAFTVAMQIATDATAGERERGSLEPLLVNPVPRWQFIAGKWLAAASVSIVGMLATLAITAYVLTRLPLEDLDIRNHLGVPECLMLGLALIPIGLMAPAMQIYLACFAKSFKEAQSYMTFLILAAVLPGTITTFYPISDKPWLKPIPILGQYSISIDILGGKFPSPWLLLASAVLALTLCAVCLWLASRLFSSEKIILGR